MPVARGVGKPEAWAGAAWWDTGTERAQALSVRSSGVCTGQERAPACAACTSQGWQRGAWGAGRQKAAPPAGEQISEALRFETGTPPVGIKPAFSSVLGCTQRHYVWALIESTYELK